MDASMSLKQRIRSVLKSLAAKTGLLDPYRKIRSFPSTKAFDRDFDRMFEEIEALEESAGQPAVLFTGIISNPKKATLFRFLDDICAHWQGLRLVLLDEGNPSESKNRTYEQIFFPRSLSHGRYDQNRWMKYEPKDDVYLEKYPKIEEYTKIIQDRQMDNGYTGIRRLLCAYAKAYEMMIERVKPSVVLIWCEFTKMHPLCADIARAHGVKVVYIEYGSVPGTLALDAQGQMGESKTATDAEAFLRLSVDDDMQQKADQVLEFLHKCGLNRNAQELSTNYLHDVHEMHDGSRPLVVFAGQNDFDSGLLPYDEHARAYHSPFFPDSLSAAKHIFKLCKENGWDFVYKPHPFMASRVPWDLAFTVVRKCNFNELLDMADVVVTAVSSTNYSALLRGRPCVTVGYNQMRGKGCAYEAKKRSEIPTLISAAIRDGFTLDMQAAFRKHIAQMLNYALYDDLNVRQLRYGRTSQQAAEYLREVAGC